MAPSDEIAGETSKEIHRSPSPNLIELQPPPARRDPPVTPPPASFPAPTTPASTAGDDGPIVDCIVGSSGSISSTGTH